MNLFRSKIRCDVPRLFRSMSACAEPFSQPIVTILDALTPAGSNLALLLKQNALIHELRLFDETRSTIPLVKDLACLDTKTCVKSFSCRSYKDAIQGAHVVISIGDHSLKCGDSQRVQFYKNLDSIRFAATFLSEFNPDAVYLIAKVPVESLVPMASEEYKKSESYDPRKVIGVTTHASMTANTLLGNMFKRDPGQIMCPVIGGMSPNVAVPVVSQVRPNVEASSQTYTKLLEQTLAMQNKETQSDLSKAAAVARFANLVVRGLLGDSKAAECAFVAQTGHIKPFLPYMSSIVKLGPHGVKSTHMPKVNEHETNLLRAAVPEILKSIYLGENFMLQGHDFQPPGQQKKRECNEMLKHKVLECAKYPNPSK